VHIKQIQLSNFRNHKNTCVGFCGGINILAGANAQGKTNLLEAVYLSCVGRGWRAARDTEMIAFGTDTATVCTTAEKAFGEIVISIKLRNGTKKAISINSVPISKVAELMGNIPCVFFSPDELRLVKDAPADRRRFLDIDISQIDKSYFYALIRYNKILSQRNAYLKNLSPCPTADDIRGLSIWDRQLVSVGTTLIQKRIAFVNNLTPHLISVHNHLTAKTENVSFAYCFLGFDGGEEVIDGTDGISEHFTRQLEKAQERDLRLHTTTVGPHRDDIKIEINGRDIRAYGSQGQQRTAALSVKIAELQLFESVTGEKPILLLDDVFSELDSSRQMRLLTFIKKTQTIITTTKIPAELSAADANIYTVAKGKVKEVIAR
jgi:DNA replication and repair protein RecF